MPRHRLTSVVEGVGATLSLVVAVALAVTLAAAHGDESRAAERIAPGVSAGGVDLSNLTLAEAETKLQATLGPAVARALALDVGGRRFSLTMRRAQLRFDARLTATRALQASPPPTALARGSSVVTVVPVALSHSRRAVAAFVREVAGRIRRAPRNATMRLGLRLLTVRRSRSGLKLDRKRAAQAIGAALDDPAAPRAVRQRVTRVAAPVTTADLRRRYTTAITVDKAGFKLRLFKNLRLVRTFPVAVGLPAYPTPSGLFAIQEKRIDPVWSVPNSDWAGDLAGTTIAAGSAHNPLKARWMRVTGSVGIHGTAEDRSIGTRASHGCIRMHVRHVKELYRRVAVGTPVLIR